MDELKKKKKGKGKIFPSDSGTDDDGLVNSAYEMDSVEKNETLNNKKFIQKVKYAVKLKSVSVNNPLNVFTALKQGASRWKDYINRKRKNAMLQDGSGVDRRCTGGEGLDYELSDKQYDTGSIRALNSKTHRQMVVAQNRNLIEYFAKLGQAKSEEEALIDFDFVDQLLESGARINCTDKYGQTVLHEAARAWHVDVVRYLLKKGADINQGDNYGRTALHIAAAVDYSDMIHFLIRKGADKEARTLYEKQTPVHFAAKSDSCLALKALIKEDCEYKTVEDYKGRTPLHLAAELDRSESARFLLELDDPAPAGVVAKSGQTAIVWMITKMPTVAKLALDQFREMDRANRKQYFHLFNLEPRACLERHKKVSEKSEPTEEENSGDEETFPQTALQVIVGYKQYDLILHPVIMKLIKVKWDKFGKLGAWLSTLQNFIFIILWTILGILVEYDDRHYYDLPSQWWRIVLFVLAVASTTWQLKDELTEFFSSKKAHKNWKEWREKEIRRDLEYAHPRWPEEEQYLKAEIEALDDTGPQYFKEYWNIFDWLCYFLLLIVIITHLVDIFDHTEIIARVHIRFMAATIILIWLRLMKNARAFSYTGPFIVMLSHMVADCFRWAFLYLEFYIPYACAFWMIFGGDKVPQAYQGSVEADNNTIIVEGLQDPNALLYSLFRMTLVDDYDYDDMKRIDSLMADILCGTWLALSAIVMLNLFIALMSDTFQRVYDNAQANAVMQKAIQILSIEEGMSKKRKQKFRDYLSDNCNPLVEFYDDDDTEIGDGKDATKVTIQIKEQLDEWEENFSHIFSRTPLPRGGKTVRRSPPGGGGYSEDRRRSSVVTDTDIGMHEEEDTGLEHLEIEVTEIKKEVRALKEAQQTMMDSFSQDLGIIKRLLLQNLDQRTEIGTVGRQPAPAMISPGVATGTSIYNLGSTRSSFRQPRDEEWDKIEKKRQQDLQKLKEQLSKQQQIIASQNIYRGTPPMTVEVTTPRPEDSQTEDDDDPQTGQSSV